MQKGKKLSAERLGRKINWADLRALTKELILTENQSVYIPLGELHRLTNPGKVPLELIEVQSGSYLGEDDIVRLEDAFGRT